MANEAEEEEVAVDEHVAPAYMASAVLGFAEQSERIGARGARRPRGLVPPPCRMLMAAQEGQAMGLTTYLVEAGQKASPRAWKWPERIATNAPLTNFAVMYTLPRIAESDPDPPATPWKR